MGKHSNLSPEKQQKLDSMLAQVDEFCADPENIEKIRRNKIRSEGMSITIKKMEEEKAEEIRKTWDGVFDI